MSQSQLFNCQLWEEKVKGLYFYKVTYFDERLRPLTRSQVKVLVCPETKWQLICGQIWPHIFLSKVKPSIYLCGYDESDDELISSCELNIFQCASVLETIEWGKNQKLSAWENRSLLPRFSV